MRYVDSRRWIFRAIQEFVDPLGLFLDGHAVEQVGRLLRAANFRDAVEDHRRRLQLPDGRSHLDDYAFREQEFSFRELSARCDDRLLNLADDRRSIATTDGQPDL